MSVPEKFVNVRRWGQCPKCHKVRELRAGWNDIMTEITLLCDRCLDVPMDEEALDMIFEKAGVDRPVRSKSQQVQRQQVQRQHAEMFSLEQIFPED